MFVPVADCHGIIDSDVLNKIFVLFDIFIIHSTTNEEDK